MPAFAGITRLWGDLLLMNYRHIYHAGNFADVFKHILLSALLQSLLRKDKPFCYLDTHAGSGNYDLFTEKAQKTQECNNGIVKLWQEFCRDETSVKTPSPILAYLDIIRSWNSEQGSALLRYYPGSPVLAQKLLRPTDKLIFSELHPEEIKDLKRLFKQDKRVSIHHLDGYALFKALLPPQESRGLVFIDPPFESEHEFDCILQSLQLGIKRWRHGIYVVWYPIKKLTDVHSFYKQLITLGIKEILVCELFLSDFLQTSCQKLQACGMAIINPPWQLKETMEITLPWLSKMISDAEGTSFKTRILDTDWCDCIVSAHHTFRHSAT